MGTKEPTKGDWDDLVEAGELVPHFQYGGHFFNREDFGRTLRDWVAFSIAFASGVACRDKQAALDLLRHEADSILAALRKIAIRDARSTRHLAHWLNGSDEYDGGDSIRNDLT
jgi:hypothetical protein